MNQLQPTRQLMLHAKTHGRFEQKATGIVKEQSRYSVTLLRHHIPVICIFRRGMSNQQISSITFKYMHDSIQFGKHKLK